MFDDLQPVKKTTQDFPRNLEEMSIDELKSYINELNEEIRRVQADIDRKRESQKAAAAAFKD